jgi:protocatechuate 3,4-dioxygenase beta subunit
MSTTSRTGAVAVAAAVALLLACGAAYFLREGDRRPDTPSAPGRDVPAPARPRDDAASGRAPEAATASKKVDIERAAFDGAPRQGEIVVAGVVYDETGATVPDAEVALIVDATRSLAAFSEGDVAATVVTKRDGAFWFDDPTAISVHERYLLRVRHPAYGVERATPIDPRDASTLRRDVVLRKTGAGVNGRVTDEFGAPIAGARVLALDPAVMSTDPVGAVEKETATDKDGRFEASSLRPGLKTVRVVAAGYTTASAPDLNLALGAPQTLEFRLARGKVIRGHAIGTDVGAGIAGAVVIARLLRLDGPDSGEAPEDADRREAELRKIAEAQREEAEARRAKGGETTPVKEGAAVEAEPVMPPEEELRRQRAQYAALRKSPPAVVRTGPDGSFELAGLEAGSYEVSVRARGYRDPPPQGARAGEDVLFELAPTGRVLGRVVDAETGAPLAEFALGMVAGPEQRIVPWASKRRFGPPATANGAFEYPDAPEGRCQLVAEAPSYAGGRSEPLTLAPSERREGVEIRMVRGCEVRGTVADAAGKPVAGAAVELEASDAATHPLAGLLLRSVRRDKLTTTTDKDGRYAFPRVMAGGYVAQATHPAFANGASVAFEAPATGAVDAPPVTLAKGSAVRGRVLRKSDGAPDPDATVRVMSYTANAQPVPFQTPLQREAATDPEGRFEVGGLPAGSYRVMVVRRENKSDFGELFMAAGKRTGKEPPTHVVAAGETKDVGDL